MEIREFKDHLKSLNLSEEDFVIRIGFGKILAIGSSNEKAANKLAHELGKETYWNGEK